MENFAPPFANLGFTPEERYLIEPFFTNLDRPVFAVPFLPPEVIGALCSRTSRAKEDLRVVFLNEFIKPFLVEKNEYGEALKNLIDFLHKYPWEIIFSNPRGREFYTKWLAQYGDDSIAQMAGTHIIFSGLSQVAIKHLEDMRVGIAPLEKSTRYLDYSAKINGEYMYYTDPTLEEMGLRAEYRAAMDCLFDTYKELSGEFLDFLKKKYPHEKELILRTKTFDTLRGLLPTSALSQIAFFANGQALEYALSRSLRHPLGEIRFAAQAALRELQMVVPAFLRRLTSDASKEYQEYLSGRGRRVREAIKELELGEGQIYPEGDGWKVNLVEYDADGEDKVLAGLLYPEMHESFPKILAKVKKLSPEKKEKLLARAIFGRSARWYKVPRAFELANLTFEITMNIGAWRDLHRHRMQTQMRQRWSVHHGYDIPAEIEAAGLDKKFKSAVAKTESVFHEIEVHNPELAQYAVTLAHRLRFLQKQNLRAFFWEAELRTIPTGHPDYRKIEQEKVKLVRGIYPILGKFVLADMRNYDFARRDTQSEIEKKENELREYFKKNRP
jgi:thymidylate synthase ThyX